MLPHHEAAEMSHKERPITPPAYEVAVSSSPEPLLNEKRKFVSSESTIEEGDVVPVRLTTSLFEVIYRRTMLVSAVLAIPLFINLIMAPVASTSWIDANLYLAAKAFFMTALHLVAMLYRLALKQTQVKRERGSVPWFLDGMYAFFHAACLALHYWCAHQGVQALDGPQDVTIYTIEVIQAGIRV